MFLRRNWGQAIQPRGAATLGGRLGHRQPVEGRRVLALPRRPPVLVCSVKGSCPELIFGLDVFRGYYLP